MKHCPNCGSDQIYRTNPKELTVYCNCCHHCWQATQSLQPIVKDSFWLSKPLKGLHHIEVWYCPNDHTKYSYRTAYQNSFFSDLKGKFDSPFAALQAGISEVKYGTDS